MPIEGVEEGEIDDGFMSSLDLLLDLAPFAERELVTEW